MKISILFVLLAQFFCTIVVAAQFDPRSFAQAERPAVFFGEFDPITLDDQSKIQSMLADHDLIVIAPVLSNSNKLLSPIETRIKMLSLLYADSKRIHIVDKETLTSIRPRSFQIACCRSELVKYLKDLRQNRHVAARKFESYLQDSVQMQKAIRAYANPLVLNMGVNPTAQQVKTYAKLIGVDTRTLQFMIHQGLYLDIIKSNSHPLLKKGIENTVTEIRKFLISNLKFDYKDVFKRIKGDWRVVEKDLRHQLAAGEELIEVRHLGSGIPSSAFLIRTNRRDFVLKIPKSNFQRHKTVEAIRTGLWMQSFGAIKTPQIIAYDKDGKWMLSELIRGENMQERFSRGLPLNDGELKSLKELYAFNSFMGEASGIQLDIDPDNLMIQDNKVYLIDTGPGFPARKLETRDVIEIYRGWLNKHGISSQANNVKSCEAIFN